MNYFLVRCTVISKSGKVINWQTTFGSRNEELSGREVMEIQDNIRSEYKKSSVFFDLIYKLGGKYE